MKRLYCALLALPAIALILTPFLPFVNKATLWLGLPSVMTWSIIWVILITVILALLEWGTPHPDDIEEQRPNTAEVAR